MPDWFVCFSAWGVVTCLGGIKWASRTCGRIWCTMEWYLYLHLCLHFGSYQVKPHMWSTGAFVSPLHIGIYVVASNHVFWLRYCFSQYALCVRHMCFFRLLNWFLFQHNLLHCVCVPSGSKGSPFQLVTTSIWALPVWGGGSKPLPGWFGALF